jgi:hypothetical protein
MNWYKTALKEYDKVPEGGHYWGTPWPKYESNIKNIDLKSPWIPVESSAIKEIAYNERLEILEIRFRKGGKAEYWGVSKKIFEGLLNARSKGEYFNRVIKPNYRKKD